MNEKQISLEYQINPRINQIKSQRFEFTNAKKKSMLLLLTSLAPIKSDVPVIDFNSILKDSFTENFCDSL